LLDKSAEKTLTGNVDGQPYSPNFARLERSKRESFASSNYSNNYSRRSDNYSSSSSSGIGYGVEYAPREHAFAYAASAPRADSSPLASAFDKAAAASGYSAGSALHPPVSAYDRDRRDRGAQAAQRIRSSKSAPRTMMGSSSSSGSASSSSSPLHHSRYSPPPLESPNAGSRSSPAVRRSASGSSPVSATLAAAADRAIARHSPSMGRQSPVAGGREASPVHFRSSPPPGVGSSSSVFARTSPPGGPSAADSGLSPLSSALAEVRGRHGIVSDHPTADPVAAFLQSARDLKTGSGHSEGPSMTVADAAGPIDAQADSRSSRAQRSGSSLRWRDEAAENGGASATEPHSHASFDQPETHTNRGYMPSSSSDMGAVRSILKASAGPPGSFEPAAPVDIKSYARKMANRQAVQKEHQSAGSSASKRTL
jgi:hypothetical protein